MSTRRKIRVCRRCHTAVIPTETPGYAFACPEHDEDLYEFETELVNMETKKEIQDDCLTGISNSKGE